MLCELIRYVQFLKKTSKCNWVYECIIIIIIIYYYDYFVTTGKFRLLMLPSSRQWEQEYIYN